MKSIETKVSNILNPAKKGGEHKVNRKQLVSGDGWELDENTGVLTISKTNATCDPRYKDLVKSVVIESSVSNIQSYSFSGFTNLTSVTFLGPLNIGYSAFQDCTSLTEITIPDGVVTIYFDTFNNCTSLTSVTIPASVTSIDNSAFSGCSGLTSVTYKGTFDPGSSSAAFTDCSKLTSAFYGCSGLTGSLTIPSSVTSIGIAAFSSCSKLTSIEVDENNPNYKSIDGVLYSKNGEKLIQCPGGKTDSVTISEGVTSIKNSAFYVCSGLTSLTIPSSVTSIEDFAFYNCSGLTSVTYTGTSDPSPGEKVFDKCEKLKAVNVPANYKDSNFCGKPVKKPTQAKRESFLSLKLLMPMLSFSALGERIWS